MSPLGTSMHSELTGHQKELKKLKLLKYTDVTQFASTENSASLNGASKKRKAEEEEQEEMVRSKSKKKKSKKKKEMA